MPCNDALVLLGILQPLVMAHGQDIEHVDILIKIQTEVLGKMLMHDAASNTYINSTALVSDTLKGSSAQIRVWTNCLLPLAEQTQVAVAILHCSARLTDFAAAGQPA